MSPPLMIDLPVELATPRLLLRAPQPGLGSALQDALAESRAELRAFLGHLPWVAAEPTLAAAELRCRQAHAAFVSRSDLPWFAFERHSGRLVGTVGLHRTDWTVPRTEVGYWIRTSAAGQGYAQEGVVALVERVAFAVMGAARVELVADATHAASRRVAERCGFTLESVQRATMRAADGRLRNTCVYVRWPDGAPMTGPDAARSPSDAG